jgi:hypothetical protein
MALCVLARSTAGQCYLGNVPRIVGQNSTENLLSSYIPAALFYFSSIACQEIGEDAIGILDNTTILLLCWFRMLVFRCSLGIINI